MRVNALGALGGCRFGGIFFRVYVFRIFGVSFFQVMVFGLLGLECEALRV